MQRRHFLSLAAALPFAGALPGSALAADPAADVLNNWYRLALELVRHTPTFSPPVASRAFALLGIASCEAVAGSRSGMVSLAGQLHGLDPFPARPGLANSALTLHATLSAMVRHLFANTGPTGQRAILAMADRQEQALIAGLAVEAIDNSRALGASIAAHLIVWSASDGGADVANMGFPLAYTPAEGPGHWVPTSKIVQQQAPLLPGWGNNRPFAMPAGDCGLPSPPAYSEAPDSAFYAEAMQVYEVSKGLSDEQRAIARFWSDDPMLSPTPPGHWIAIALLIIRSEDLSLARSADLLARVGIAVADAFIACWREKYRYDLLRPVTYIQRLIDPSWQPLLITPPFPEYPSGHSTQSAAAAEVLTAILGENFAFEDATHAEDGLPARSFPDFRAAAAEAALSRLYGGIHFRAAIDRGLEQGRCVAAHAIALRTLA